MAAGVIENWNSTSSAGHFSERATCISCLFLYDRAGSRNRRTLSLVRIFSLYDTPQVTYCPFCLASLYVVSLPCTCIVPVVVLPIGLFFARKSN